METHTSAVPKRTNDQKCLNSNNVFEDIGMKSSLCDVLFNLFRKYAGELRFYQFHDACKVSLVACVLTLLTGITKLYFSKCRLNMPYQWPLLTYHIYKRSEGVKQHFSISNSSFGYDILIKPGVVASHKCTKEHLQIFAVSVFSNDVSLFLSRSAKFLFFSPS